MSTSKESPEALALRAPPRPVTRLNRRMLAVVVGRLAATVLGGTLWSLQSSRKNDRDAPVELHNIDRIARAERSGAIAGRLHQGGAAKRTCCTGVGAAAAGRSGQRDVAGRTARRCLTLRRADTSCRSRRRRGARRAHQSTARGGGGGQGIAVLCGERAKGPLRRTDGCRRIDTESLLDRQQEQKRARPRQTTSQGPRRTPQQRKKAFLDGSSGSQTSSHS